MADTDPQTPEEQETTGWSAQDWANLADMIWQTREDRRDNPKRMNRELQWTDVDRQVEMAAVSRLDEDNRPGDMRGAWMTSQEMPWQAIALEVSMADVKRLNFSSERAWFSAHAKMDDREMEKLENRMKLAGLDSLSGELLEAAGRGSVGDLNQDDLDAIVEGTHEYFQALYPFRANTMSMHAESYKYGTCVGRMKLCNVSDSYAQARAIQKTDQRIPCLVPQSIKQTYLDDTCSAVLHENHLIEPSQIYCWMQNIDDLRMAAEQGDRDPDKENGGWMPEALIDVEPRQDCNNSVELLEWEGDAVVHTSTSVAYLPNVLVTVVCGAGQPKVLRFRKREFPFSSYLIQSYMQEDMLTPYSSSPLMKGAPIQVGGTEAYNRSVDASCLNTQPVVQYSPFDQYLLASGGPEIVPGAKWPAQTPVNVIPIGDPAQLLNVALLNKQEHQDAVGMSAPRIGAQTKSHQTRFAVATEQTRGQIRTVAYVTSTFDDLWRTMLAHEHVLLKSSMAQQDIYLPKYRGWIEMSKDLLPSQCVFDVTGAGELEQEREKQLVQQNALAEAVRLEVAQAQLKSQGIDPAIDIPQMQRMILINAGLEPEQFFTGDAQSVPDQTETGPGVPGVAGVSQSIGAVPLAALGG